MKPITLVALALIAIGVVAFAYQGITYKTQEKAFDIGTVHVTTEKTHTIPLSPIVGGVALISGAVLLVLGNKKNV
jgi:hypothetical protein